MRGPEWVTSKPGHSPGELGVEDDVEIVAKGHDVHLVRRHEGRDSRHERMRRLHDVDAGRRDPRVRQEPVAEQRREPGHHVGGAEQPRSACDRRVDRRVGGMQAEQPHARPDGVGQGAGLLVGRPDIARVGDDRVGSRQHVDLGEVAVHRASHRIVLGEQVEQLEPGVVHVVPATADDECDVDTRGGAARRTWHALRLLGHCRIGAVRTGCGPSCRRRTPRWCRRSSRRPGWRG